MEAVSPELGNRVQRVRVQLPGTSQELLTKFREKKVDFAAHTATEDGGAVFLNLLGMAVGVNEAVMFCLSPGHAQLRVRPHSALFIIFHTWAGCGCAPWDLMLPGSSFG